VKRARLALGALLTCLIAQPCAADETIGLCLNADLQQRLRAEMRELLGALHGVHVALAERDFEAVAERAAAAGAGMKGQVEHGGEHHAGLPHDFVKQGRATHAAFDDLATLARDGGKPRQMFPALADVTGHCVACHAKYRLAPAGDCVTDEPSSAP